MSTRSFKEFIRDITVKPLIIFPLVGLAHVVGLLWVIWENRTAPINGLEWISALWMLGYTVCWIAACDYLKWGALCYIALTTIDIVLLFFLKSYADKVVYTSLLVPFINGIFCFFLLLFYKRFR